MRQAVHYATRRDCRRVRRGLLGLPGRLSGLRRRGARRAAGAAASGFRILEGGERSVDGYMLALAGWCTIHSDLPWVRVLLDGEVLAELDAGRPREDVSAAMATATGDGTCDTAPASGGVELHAAARRRVPRRGDPLRAGERALGVRPCSTWDARVDGAALRFGSEASRLASRRPRPRGAEPLLEAARGVVVAARARAAAASGRRRAARRRARQRVRAHGIRPAVPPLVRLGLCPRVLARLHPLACPPRGAAGLLVPLALRDAAGGAPAPLHGRCGGGASPRGRTSSSRTPPGSLPLALGDVLPAGAGGEHDPGRSGARPTRSSSSTAAPPPRAAGASRGGATASSSPGREWRIAGLRVALAPLLCAALLLAAGHAVLPRGALRRERRLVLAASPACCCCTRWSRSSTTRGLPWSPMGLLLPLLGVAALTFVRRRASRRADARRARE